MESGVSGVYFLLLAVLVVAVWMHRDLLWGPVPEEFQSVLASPLNGTTLRGLETLITRRPSLWWFVDDETNARNWWDFGARNSRLPNRGYLQVALESLMATQAFDFDIHVLLGREAVSDVLRTAGATVPTGIRQLPVSLWRQWAVANLCAEKGGLVMVGDSTLCVGPSFGPLVKDAEAGVFGISSDITRAVPGSSDSGSASLPPAPWVGWAARPHTSVWDIAATHWTRLVAAGPTGWSAAEARRMYGDVWAVQKRQGVVHFQAADGGRRNDGVERTLEDLFAKVTVPADPKIVISPAVMYVPADGDALVRDRRYAWFVRMSKEQILASDFVWASLAKKHRVRLFKN